MAGKSAMVTVSDVLARLGGIPADRIRVHPAPGEAKPADALRIAETEGKLCELIDGVLVEKPMGVRESRLAALLIRYLDEFIEKHDLGFLTCPDGPVFVDEAQLRYPDIGYFSWRRFPNRVVPDDAILELVPDLAVEVISPSNTAVEMERKRREYFSGGSKLVWEVFPEDRRIDIYANVDQFVSRGDGEVLDGGEVLSGFELDVTKLFERAGRGTK
jgi:Uma2 family endonuclease